MAATAGPTLTEFPNRPLTGGIADAVRPSRLRAWPKLAEAARTVGSGLPVIVLGLVLLQIDANYFWRDDTQLYHLAGYSEAARAWHQGEWPLLSQATWQGGALAAEYLNGVFSLFLQLCGYVVFALELSPPRAGAALALVHLAVLAMGAYRLARQRGLAVEVASLVALL